MGLLVEYTLKDAADHDAQAAAMETLCAALKALTDRRFSYQGFASEDPLRFYGVLQYDGEAGKQQFLDSAAFKTYQTGARERLAGPPKTTPIRASGSSL